MEQLKERKDIRKTVCMKAEQWEQIEREAQRVGLTQNAVFRAIIEMYFHEQARQGASAENGA